MLTVGNTSGPSPLNKLLKKKEGMGREEKVGKGKERKSSLEVTHSGCFPGRPHYSMENVDNKTYCGGNF